jgi:hypothetical protein
MTETTSKTDRAAARTQGPTQDAGYGFGGSTGGVQRSCFDCGECPPPARLADQQRLHPEPDPVDAVRPDLEERAAGGSSGEHGVCVDGYTSPVTRSPLDPWHSEEYLVACLVKMHGWRWQEARVLRGPFRKHVKSFMNPEGS